MATKSSEMLSIGSELLLGETVDTNAAFLGAELARLGVPLRQVRALPDDRSVLAAAFAEARSRAALVVATGGLGPTHDDLTREGLADALGGELTEDAALRTQLEQRFRAFGPMPASNLRQALRVPSAEPLANPLGSAPGWWVDRDGVTVVLLPGVPSEMRRMWDEEVRPRLVERFAAPALSTRTVKAFGVGESAAAERLGELLTAPPDGIVAGIYARDDGIHVRFSTHGAPSTLEPLVAQALSILGVDAYGTDDADLATAALASLGNAGIGSLASWEADTGGALLGVLSAAEAASNGSAQYVGGMLDAGGALAAPVADAVLQLALEPAGVHGRSRVKVSMSGGATIEPTTMRIHGSGPQRLRRAAYAALDLVRRRLG